MTDAPISTRLDKLLNVPGGVRLRDTLLTATTSIDHRMRLFWYNEISNFGDALSPVVVAWATGRGVTWVSRRYQGKLLAIGSILQSAIARGDTVWGSGIITDDQIRPPRNVTFLAVRGPLSRSRILADVPETYGDPAILLPEFHKSPVDRIFRIGIVPHRVDRSLLENPRDPAVTVIDAGEPWRKVVDRIRACETILSSSLHGLIIAEAYGIPASWVRISENIRGGTFKFHDYLLASGREASPPIPWNGDLSIALAGTLPDAEFDVPSLLSAIRR